MLQCGTNYVAIGDKLCCNWRHATLHGVQGRCLAIAVDCYILRNTLFEVPECKCHTPTRVRYQHPFSFFKTLVNLATPLRTRDYHAKGVSFTRRVTTALIYERFCVFSYYSSIDHGASNLWRAFTQTRHGIQTRR